MKKKLAQVAIAAPLCVSLAGCEREETLTEAVVIAESSERVEGAWWRAALSIDEERVIPFFVNLPEFESGEGAVIRNGVEDIPVACAWDGQSLVLEFPHYDSRVEAQLTSEGDLEGEWTITRRDGVKHVAFAAKQLDAYLPLARMGMGDWGAGVSAEKVEPARESIWSMDFEDSGPAKGVFAEVAHFTGEDAQGSVLQGTILTPTGDYRFLAGSLVKRESNVHRREFGLSVFDGAHAFLFTGAILGDVMAGTFYSGNWWREEFVASRLGEGETFELPDAFSETNVTAGDQRLRLPALENAQYQGKAVLVNIFGTWCPNCHDEAPFLRKLYEKHHDEGLEILSLAYEHTGDDERSRAQVARFRERYAIPWEILIVGTSDTEQASATLPSLTRIKCFPTTVFVGRDGVVRAVHTGFSGPATGEAHEQVRQEFEAHIREILSVSIVGTAD